MLKKSMLLSTIISLGLLGMTGAHATTANFPFTSPTGDLGSDTHTYTNNGVSITAVGHTGVVGATTTDTGNVNLFGKDDGNDENGLGLVNDPSHDNEITSGSYIELMMPTSLTSLSFEMGSTTGPDAWAVWGCTSGLSGCTELLTGSDESTHSLTTLNSTYIFTETATGLSHPNVLLGDVSLTVSTTPLPATAWMFLPVIGLVIFGLRKSRNADMGSFA